MDINKLIKAITGRKRDDFGQKPMLDPMQHPDHKEYEERGQKPLSTPVPPPIETPSEQKE